MRKRHVEVSQPPAQGESCRRRGWGGEGAGSLGSLGGGSSNGLLLIGTLPLPAPPEGC